MLSRSFIIKWTFWTPSYLLLWFHSDVAVSQLNMINSYNNLSMIRIRNNELPHSPPWHHCGLGFVRGKGQRPLTSLTWLIEPSTYSVKLLYCNGHSVRLNNTCIQLLSAWTSVISTLKETFANLVFTHFDFLQLIINFCFGLFYFGHLRLQYMYPEESIKSILTSHTHTSVACVDIWTYSADAVRPVYMQTLQG